MNLPLFASLIVFLLVLGRVLRKSTKQLKEEQQSFWQRERASNEVRKKPLDDLEYISIPLDKLPIKIFSEDSIIGECVEVLLALSACKIVNLTGISNTDLKFTYGTANITVLSEYDQNYTLLVTTLQKWADRLMDLEDTSSARTVLEYAVSINSDITKTYIMLADIYDKLEASPDIQNLMIAAEKLTTPSGKIILRKLQQTYGGTCHE